MVAAVAVVVASGLATLKLFNSNDRGFTALELANIEALANNEAEPILIPCHSSGSRNSNERYTDCSTCLPVIGYKGKGTEALCKPK